MWIVRKFKIWTKPTINKNYILSYTLEYHIEHTHSVDLYLLTFFSFTPINSHSYMPHLSRCNISGRILQRYQTHSWFCIFAQVLVSARKSPSPSWPHSHSSFRAHLHYYLQGYLPRASQKRSDTCLCVPIATWTSFMLLMTLTSL